MRALQEMVGRDDAEFDVVTRRLRGLDLNPVGQEKTDLIREVLRLVRGVILRDRKNGVRHQEIAGFLDPGIQPRIREIGERIWEITGDADPEFISWFYGCDLRSVPRCYHRALEFVWDGIGPYRA